VGGAVVIAAFALPLLNQRSLIYYPYPKLSLPDFDPVIGMMILGLLAPVVASSAVAREISESASQ
jgi:hypothetical protein